MPPGIDEFDFENSIRIIHIIVQEHEKEFDPLMSETRELRKLPLKCLVPKKKKQKKKKKKKKKRRKYVCCWQRINLKAALHY
jgi:hypothetical protein